MMMNLLFKVNDAVSRYYKYLIFEVEFNANKNIIKVAYIVGILISVFVSLYIIDYYAKR